MIAATSSVQVVATYAAYGVFGVFAFIGVAAHYRWAWRQRCQRVEATARRQRIRDRAVIDRYTA